MTREEKAIIYFKDLRKRFFEDFLLCIPQNTVTYKATMAEKEFYDEAIKALEQINKIADIVDGTIDHFEYDDAMDMLYEIKGVIK